MRVVFQKIAMKTNVYKKDVEVEGYRGEEGSPKEKTDVEKAYEAGNDTNEVTSFGNEPLEVKNSRGLNEDTIKAKDGFDNTGTQGKDSLHDDAYPHKDGIETKQSAESETGSSSNDFK